MKSLILYFIIIFSYYILGAYATTDILRLLKGSSVSVNAPNCYCPYCNTQISLWDQLPLISYFINHGVCRKCKSRIPISDLFLEFFLFVFFCVITFLSHFSWPGFFLCILFYESTKIVFILHFGKRERNFTKNMVLSLVNNLFLFSIIAFFFALIPVFNSQKIM